MTRNDEWQRPRQRTAKVRHTCDWCQTLIVVGERYTYWFGLETGGYGTASTKAHDDCWAAMDREASRRGWDELDWVGTHKRGMTTEESERNAS